MDTGRSDSLFYNGRILTFGAGHQQVKALVAEGGKVAGVGSDAEMRRLTPRGSMKIDLGGKVVLPGFIDCHTHFIQMGMDSMSVNLASTRTLDEALALIKAAGRRAPKGEWVIATSWKESGWPGGRFITKQDLDSCCPDNPAVAHRVCGHLSTVNTKGMSMLGIGPATPDAELESGILRESAVEIARSATVPDRKMKEKGLNAAVRMAHALGVTSINDNGSDSDFATYHDAERRGKLGVRVWFNTPASDLDSRLRMGIATGFGTDWLRLGGTKVFCDGALGARTAALSEPYADDPGNKGMLVHDRAELEGIVARANEASIQVAAHAIGDVGIGEVLSAMSKALDARPNRGARHRIEHLELPTRGQLRDMRTMGIIASMQPNFIGEWGGTDGMYTSRLGKGRTSTNNPFRTVLDSKVRLVFGSDCMPFSPIYGIHSAVNAPHEAQRLTVREAISAYTSDAAYASFDERVKGSLEEGKLADLVVLSRDPFEESERISEIEVLKTVIGGELVYERPRTKTRTEGE